MTNPPPQTNESSNLLIVQLSDFHVRSVGDACLGRAGAVVAALRPLVRYASGCIVALTGDLTWSGAESEFEAFATFADELRCQLANALGDVPWAITIVPGNHDCDFSTAQPTRDGIVANIGEPKGRTRDDSTTWICTQPLTKYFEFASAYSTPPPAPPFAGATVPPLAQVQRFHTSDGRAVKVICLHTAWCSQLHEKPAMLWFPEDVLPTPEPDCLTLVLQHHPLHWLEPTNHKELRRRLEATADLILTGHEHEPDGRSFSTTDGGAALYLEGGLFQVIAGTSATFNVVALNIGTRTFCHTQYVWNDEEGGFRQAAHNSELATPTSWPELPLARKRAGATYMLKPSFEQVLDQRIRSANRVPEVRVRLAYFSDGWLQRRVRPGRSTSRSGWRAVRAPRSSPADTS